jgi:hypothetical protein
VLIVILIVFLVFSYASGMNILPKIVAGIPGPHPTDLDLDYHEGFFFLAEAITPLIFLIGATCIILLSLRQVLKRREFSGIGAEFILITNSLIMIALSLQILGDRIPNKETTIDLLYSVALVFVLLALGSLITGFSYKYLKPVK